MSRRSAGAEMRRLRNAKGLKVEDVATHLGTSTTRISRMETGKGRVSIKPEEVAALCDLFDVQDQRARAMLADMFRAAQQPGWWDPYRDVLPSGLEVLLDLETNAERELGFEVTLVHGLMQTPAYTRVLLEASPSVRREDIADSVALRQRRQELVTRTDKPLNVWIILDEYAIRRDVGGEEVNREQRQHLAEMAELPNVTLQVIPANKGAHPGLAGQFALFEFEANPSVVYVDSPAGNLYLEKRTDVRKFGVTFDLLRASALDPADTIALLRTTPRESFS
ncbi:helix-turn-helix transcriptional regulator [Streptomyces sp. NPDC048623]|uniref:helix-turn-helix domain-containing protein n=1 Tax=Streptomyces sp. NPDC048623 TaxID=3155761 RepID=UPI003417C9F6